MLRKDVEKERRRRRRFDVFGPVAGFGSAIICIAMLAVAISSNVSSGGQAVAESEVSESNIDIKLGGDFYRTVFGPSESEIRADERADAEAEFEAEKESLFSEEDGKLYVNYDGRKLQVVDTDEGLHVIEEDGTEEEIGEAIAGIGNPKIMTDENGNRYYHIVWGDTLCKISSDVHYSVDELAEYDLRIPD